jgi:hypothetical protein
VAAQAAPVQAAHAAPVQAVPETTSWATGHHDQWEWPSTTWGGSDWQSFE